MKVTYFLGNGFDLNLGLKTRYRDFLEIYSKISSAGIVADFKSDIKSDLENWSDFEMSFGSYLEENGVSASDAIEIRDDVVRELNKYFLEIQKEFLGRNAAGNFSMGKCLSDLLNPFQYLTAVDQAAVKRRMGEKGYDWDREFGKPLLNVVSFNYTKTLDAIIGNDFLDTDRLKKIHHIHGSVPDDLVFGVNDFTQSSQIYLAEGRRLSAAIHKPDTISAIGTGVSEECESCIKNSDVIVIYGMSIGPSDKKWWDLVLRHYEKTACPVIFFGVDNRVTESRLYKRVEVLDEYICRLSGREGYADNGNIFGAFNTGMLNLMGE